MRFSDDEIRLLVKQGKIKVSEKDQEKLFGEKEKKKTTNKYGNNKCVVDGITFDSTFEGKRYQLLKLLELSGAIKDLQLQVPFELLPSFKRNGKTIRKITYIADFVYIDTKSGATIVEDTKGCVTKEYAIKRKLLLYKYPDITFREVRANSGQ